MQNFQKRIQYYLNFFQKKKKFERKALTIGEEGKIFICMKNFEQSINDKNVIIRCYWGTYYLSSLK